MSEISHEYLTFFLADGEYGVDILSVQEIMVLSPITKIPGMPIYLKGVINLRGVIVPIVDLRCRFGIEAREYDPSTVVIVLRSLQNNNTIVVGVVVDAVSEVYKLTTADIKPAPDFGSDIDSRYISYLATIDEKIVSLLDTASLLSMREIKKVQDISVPVAS